MENYIKKFRDNNQEAWQKISRIHWGKLVLVVLGAIGLSFLFVYFLRGLSDRLPLSVDSYSWLAYLTVFVSLLVINLTVIAPVPIGISIMVTAAMHWNPVFVALVGSLGAAIGELSGYFVGYFGRKVALSDDGLWGIHFEGWIKSYGALAIFILSFQPILPFDIAGIAAGAVKMPLKQFWPALWSGRFLKFLIFVYSGVGIIAHIPFLLH